MNKEYGGFIEYETSRGEMLHDQAIHLNCGRRAFSYLIKSRSISKIWIPKLTCGSILEPFQKAKVNIFFYSLENGFFPCVQDIPKEDWMLLINYYGQISNEWIEKLHKKHKNLLVDNTQAYFQKPISGIDTVYSCRKFFGVTDGAILYTEKKLNETLERDESFQRMIYLLGRYERTASEFYEMYVRNNAIFDQEPIKKMSKLTHNILCGIDYSFVQKRRTENFQFLNTRFKSINKLFLEDPEGAFMYPLYINNGDVIRNELISRNIYIPILWPDVYQNCNEDDIEYNMAKNILPFPVDQRYGINDMQYIVNEVLKVIRRTNNIIV